MKIDQSMSKQDPPAKNPADQKRSSTNIPHQIKRLRQPTPHASTSDFPLIKRVEPPAKTPDLNAVPTKSSIKQSDQQGVRQTHEDVVKKKVYSVQNVKETSKSEDNQQNTQGSPQRVSQKQNEVNQKQNEVNQNQAQMTQKNPETQSQKSTSSLNSQKSAVVPLVPSVPPVASAPPVPSTSPVPSAPPILPTSPVRSKPGHTLIQVRTTGVPQKMSTSELQKLSAASLAKHSVAYSDTQRNTVTFDNSVSDSSKELSAKTVEKSPSSGDVKGIIQTSKTEIRTPQTGINRTSKTEIRRPSKTEIGRTSKTEIRKPSKTEIHKVHISENILKSDSSQRSSNLRGISSVEKSSSTTQHRHNVNIHNGPSVVATQSHSSDGHKHENEERRNSLNKESQDPSLERTSDGSQTAASIFTVGSQDNKTLKSSLKKKRGDRISIVGGDMKILQEIPQNIMKTVMAPVKQKSIDEDLIDEEIFDKEEEKIISAIEFTDQIMDGLDIGMDHTEKKTVTIHKNNCLEGPTFSYQYDDIGLGERFYAAMTVYNDEIHHIDLTMGKEETKATVLEKAIRLAAKMESLGLNQDDVVVICSKSHSDQNVALLGSVLLGAIVAPLDPEMTMDECSNLIKQLCPKIIFCDPRCNGQLKNALRVNNLDGSCEMVLFCTDKPRYNGFDSFVSQFHFTEFTVTEIGDPRQKIAFILPTTGTTGMAKLCAITHYAISCRTILWKTKILRGSRKIISWFPLSWYMQLIINCACYELPITRIIPNTFSERSACKTIYELQIDRVLLGTVYALMLSKNVARIDFDMGCLRAIIIGGSTTTPSKIANIWKCFHYVKIFQCYGTTETGLVSLICINDSIHMQKKATSSGHIIEGTLVKILDIETGEHVLPNEVGLLSVKCEGLMKEYYNNPERYAKSIDADGFFHTLDVGYYSATDCLYIKGRNTDVYFHDDMILTTLEVDEFLIRHPHIEDAATVSNGKILISYVIKAKDKIVTATEIYYLLEKYAFPPYLIPKNILFVETFPRTSIGKVKKYILAEEAFAIARSWSTHSIE